MNVIIVLSIQHVSSGDLLRAHIKDGTPLGKEAKAFIDKGDLVPDATMVGLISGELKAMSGVNWLLDGFPRTLAQARALQGLDGIRFFSLHCTTT